MTTNSDWLHELEVAVWQEHERWRHSVQPRNVRVMGVVYSWLKPAARAFGRAIAFSGAVVFCSPLAAKYLQTSREESSHEAAHEQLR